ncbi:MAG: hypothetical protein KAW19_11160 [Candidatus Aminicenantes bacterium]|nr:hypothetical protein [Candidatus Aminicenantes bacterium]
MDRKIFSIGGIILLLFVTYSCVSHPEEALLKRYFNACSLNDIATMSKMALEPIKIDFESWEIINIGEEMIEPASLPEINQKELELKKKVEESVGITLDAKEDLDIAEFDLEKARTRAARNAAGKKINEMKAKYEEQREKHNLVQKDYNEAKAAAKREDEISTFSLGRGEVPNIRDFTGEVYSKDVEVRIKGESGTKDYKISLKKYILKDEVAGMTFRGRLIILKFEDLN